MKCHDSQNVIFQKNGLKVFLVMAGFETFISSVMTKESFQISLYQF